MQSKPMWCSNSPPLSPQTPQSPPSPRGLQSPAKEQELKAPCAQAALAALESPCTQSFLFIWLFRACDSPSSSSLLLSAAAATLPVTSQPAPEEAALSSLCFFKLSFSTPGRTSLKSLLIPTGDGAKRKHHFPQTFSFPRATGRLSSALSTVSSRNKTAQIQLALSSNNSWVCLEPGNSPTSAQLKAQWWQRAAAELPR